MVYKKYKRFRRARGGWGLPPAVPKNRWSSRGSGFFDRARTAFNKADRFITERTGRPIKGHANDYINYLIEQAENELVHNRNKRKPNATKKPKKPPVGAPPYIRKPPGPLSGSPSSPDGKGKLSQRIRPVGTGSSFSKYRYYHPAGWIKKIYKRLEPIQFYRQVQSQRLDIIKNEQSYTYRSFLRNDLVEAMCSMVQSEGSSTTATTMGMPNQRWLLGGYSSRLMMTNQTNANLYVTLYELQCRKETKYDPVTAYEQGMTNEYSAATGAFAGWTGTSSTETAVTTTYGAKTLGTTPFQSSFFCTRYKILKVITLELAPGRSHLHYSNVTLNKYMKQEESDSYPADETDVYQAYTYRSVMIFANGAPINDATTTSKVGTSSGALDLVHTITYRYRYMKPQQTKFIIYDNLPLISSEEVMTEEAAKTIVDKA